MSTTKPTIYLCNDKNCVGTTYLITTYLSKKFQFHNIINMSIDNKDFSIIVPMLSEAVSEYSDALGIIISEYSMYPSMMANRNKHTRAIVCENEKMVIRAVEKYDMNVFCLPDKITVPEQYELMIDAFIDTKRKQVYSPEMFLLERL